MLKTVLLLKEGEDNLGVSFILGFPDAQRVVLAGDGERRTAGGQTPPRPSWVWGSGTEWATKTC